MKQKSMYGQTSLIFNTEYSTSLDCDLTNQEVLISQIQAVEKRATVTITKHGTCRPGNVLFEWAWPRV
ncbi:unnamed protein product, partial [Larinioides sclopetarius]